MYDNKFHVQCIFINLLTSVLCHFGITHPCCKANINNDTILLDYSDYLRIIGYITKHLMANN